MCLFKLDFLYILLYFNTTCIFVSSINVANFVCLCTSLLTITCQYELTYTANAAFPANFKCGLSARLTKHIIYLNLVLDTSVPFPNIYLFAHQSLAFIALLGSMTRN